MEVELLAVDRRLIDLEVAGVQDDADRRVNRQRDAVGHAVRDANELDAKPADLHDIARPHRVQTILDVQTMLVELGPHERERQRGAVDRTIDVRQQIGHGPDVVLVPMREHERRHALLLQLGQVGNDEIDAEDLAFRERHAGIDDETRVAAHEGHEVHAELSEAPERDDFNRRTGRGGRVRRLS